MSLKVREDSHVLSCVTQQLRAELSYAGRCEQEGEEREEKDSLQLSLYPSRLIL